MMQIVHCDECGGSSIALEAVSVHVELNKHHHCDKCYHGHEEKTTYFFCSEGCFHEYLVKVAKGEKQFKFNRYAGEIRVRPVQLQSK